MPHIVKKSYLTYCLAFCLAISLLSISADYTSLPESYNNSTGDLVATVTTTLSSSATGDTFCPGDAITFTALPDDAESYSFYINGVLKQGPYVNNIFLPSGILFDQDKITVNLQKTGDTGTASLGIQENRIDDPGKIYFKDHSDTLDQLTVCYGFNSVNIESYRSAEVNGTLLALTDNRYQWMSSTNNNTWTAIIGANQRNYNPPGFTATTYFRRDIINDLNGTVCRSESNALKVEIEVELEGGDISPAEQTLCEGEVSDELKVENGVTGKTVTYQWQRSYDNNVFTDILINANSMSYQPGTVNETIIERSGIFSMLR
ncbi:MAG: hypothetical protein CBC02_002925 [Flavobacteriaceae bacterium TMED42]|nr:MAG: hypothetical protein CBC02_002925 [Flavobacteriaceae bacterium TMED42]